MCVCVCVWVWVGGWVGGWVLLSLDQQITSGYYHKTNSSFLTPLRSSVSVYYIKMICSQGNTLTRVRGKGDAAGGGTAPCQLRRASMQCFISKTTGRTFSTDCLNYSRKKSDPSLRLVNHCFSKTLSAGPQHTMGLGLLWYTFI